MKDDARRWAQIDEALQHAGFGVDLVGDGEAALAQAARMPPDLVILDLVLSGLPGIEVLRRLRVEGPRRLPILVLARGEGDPVQAALALGRPSSWRSPSP